MKLPTDKNDAIFDKTESSLFSSFFYRLVVRNPRAA